MSIFLYKYYSIPVGDLTFGQSATRFWAKYTHDVPEELAEDVVLIRKSW